MELEEPAWSGISYDSFVHIRLCHSASLIFSLSSIRESGMPEKKEIQRGITVYPALPDACPIP